MLKRILIFFVAGKILILLFSYFATFILPINLTFTAFKVYGLKLPYFAWVWGNFDGIHYMDIAERNYYLFREQPFFPLYPFLIRFLVDLSGLPLVISGQVISNLSLFVSLLIIWKLLILDEKSNLIYLFILIMLLFPTSFFYGAVYNDSIFLLLATLTIYFSRTRHFFWAGLAAGFATLARLNGLALFFLIFFEYIFSQNKKLDYQWNFKNMIIGLKNRLTVRNIIKNRVFTAFLSPLAFLGYLVYVQTNFGNWNAVFSTMKIWNQDKMIFPLQTLWRYLKIIFLFPTFKLNYWVAILELLSVFLYVFMLIYSFKKIRFSYWIFFAISIFIPSLTGTFQGMPRYGLHLYPFFLTLAMLLEKKLILTKIIYFVVSASLLFFSITLFTRGYFIA